MPEDWDMSGEGDEVQSAPTQPQPKENADGKTPQTQPQEQTKPAAQKSPYRGTVTPQPAGIHPAKIGAKNSESSNTGFAAFDENFPKDKNKCRAILAQVRSLPENTKARKVEKLRRIKLISEQINRLSNPSPVIHIDANAQAKTQANHPKMLQRERLEMKAREDADVKGLLAEFDKQAETIVSQATAIADLQKQVEQLKPK